MADITIAVHCWRYSRLLAYQFGGLFRWPPKCMVAVHVYCAEQASGEDDATWECVRWHAHHSRLPETVEIYHRPLPVPRLKNRSIGRNLAAKACQSRLLYFSDCDYIFGPGYLDAVNEQVTDDMIVAYPRRLWKCEPWVGDDYVDRVEPGRLAEIEVDDFKPESLRKAIGGVQIVPQRIARKYGYLPDHRRHQADKAHWVKTSSDVVWRKHVCHGEGVSQTGTDLNLPPVYRIRHTQHGRDNPELVM